MPASSAESDPGNSERANASATDEFSSGGWPSALTASENTPNAAAPDSDESAAYESETDAASNTAYVGFWPEPSSDPWAAPAPASGEADERAEAEPEIALQTQAASPAPEPSHEATRRTDPRETIYSLLDQLRDTVDQLDDAPMPDLSDVVSDLEVAVTPPGALPADEVAELRETLFAARERPRDIDTVVDLTKRIDALVALVIAYDRAIAAIERSLAALRRTEPPTETPTLSHGSMDEE